jgi:signal transduction histidine kinase
LPLSAVIAEQKQELLARFVGAAKACGAAESLPDEQIINSLALFVDELVVALSADAVAQGQKPEQSTERSQSALGHGQQRFALGYEVGALVREYGVLRELLFDVVEESRTPVSVREMRLLAKFFIGAIGDAAGQYAAARDEELRKRTAQHIAFLAHELRNPLGSVKLGFELMQERGDIRLSKSVPVVQRGIARLSSLVDDALVTVRLAEASDVNRVPLALRALVEEVARDSEAELGAKGQRIDIEGEASVSADPKIIRSALSNLVRNAVKFTPRDRTIHVRIKPTSTRVVIEVEDACGGLPPDATKKLFDPFVQAGADRSGFGLGLAICKQAAEAHGGEIRVHDLPGRGCVFVLDLPIEAPRVA